MKKTNTNEEYEQLTMDFGDEIPAVETVEEEPKRAALLAQEEYEAKQKELEVGAVVTVNPEAKRFCDGRGIPDYARKAYIKRLNPATKTVLIETEPNGKELGLLFMSDVVLA